MNSINICSIITDTPDAARHTIAYNPDDRQLYEAETGDPVGILEGVQFDAIADAVKACEVSWCSEGWGLEWTFYRIKSEYFDRWDLDDADATTNLPELVSLARNWETTVEALMEQVEEV